MKQWFIGTVVIVILNPDPKYKSQANILSNIINNVEQEPEDEVNSSVVPFDL